MAVNQTAQKILTVAQKFVQIRGFNGFSYRDLAQEIGIKTSSIHYHFPTKDDLALGLIAAYRQAFNLELQKISSQETTARSQLEEYVKLFEMNLKADNKFCLCGMLASEVNSLSDRVKRAIQGFFDDNESWLSQLIKNGQVDGSFKATISPQLMATQLLATLEGALLIARSQEKNSLGKFQEVVRGAMQSFD